MAAYGRDHVQRRLALQWGVKSMKGTIMELKERVSAARRNTTNPEDLLPFDPEIERTILAARRVVSLSHRINTELDPQLNSDSGHSDCVHSIDLSDCDSDSISDSLVSTNSDIMAGEQVKSGLIHLLPKFHGLAVSAPLSI
ncbi:hypothetical protein K1719_032053 [Acacia pycnantha]|nr:hypothetical protein K1719_032053 [Acacia pycnantha]